MMDDKPLREQLDYYNARAHEYDTSLEPLSDPDQPADRPEGREWKASGEISSTLLQGIFSIVEGVPNFTTVHIFDLPQESGPAEPACLMPFR